MALGLTAGIAHSSAVDHFVSSAATFRYYFRDLKSAGSPLSPVERFVFSLMLANTPSTAADPCVRNRRT